MAVTGPGKVEAAVAVSYVCAKYGTDESTFILNIGSAAGAPNCSDEHVQSVERSELIGQWFIGNQLVDGDTKRTYYPDILYRHPFAEEGIETVSIVRRPDEMKQMIRMDASVNGGQKSGSSLKIRLCDMEAVGVYQAAVRFVGQHQMAFLKVVSDVGVDKRMTAEDLQHFFADSAEKICTWIEDVRTLSRSWKVEKVGAKEQEILQLLCDQTHASVTMRLQMEQLLRYCTLANIPYEEMIRGDLAEQTLCCRDRKEGKVYFEQLKERLLYQ